MRHGGGSRIWITSRKLQILCLQLACLLSEALFHEGQLLKTLDALGSHTHTHTPDEIARKLCAHLHKQMEPHLAYPYIPVMHKCFYVQSRRSLEALTVYVRTSQGYAGSGYAQLSLEMLWRQGTRNCVGDSISVGARNTTTDWRCQHGILPIASIQWRSKLA